MMTTIDVALLSTVSGGQAATSTAPQSADDAAVAAAQNEFIGQSVIDGQRALACSNLDAAAASLAGTAAGTKVQGAADACWSTLRTGMLTGQQ
jgi:hypothetical protein